MNTNRQINCFLAFAFNESDVDVLIDRTVVPLLRENGITPLIADANKQTHNENIDQRIIKLIGRAQIAIVDLTYSRPSVYYEAGYAEREVPTIYTVRIDHLDRSTFLKDYRIQVHFDVTKKPIIEWDINDLKSFKRKLLKRVKHETREMKRDLTHKIEEGKRSKTFSILSIGKQIRSVRNAFREEFSKYTLQRTEESPIYERYSGAIEKKQVIIRVAVLPSIGVQLMKQINNVFQRFGDSFHLKGLTDIEMGKLTKSRCKVIYLMTSLKKVDVSRFKEVFYLYQNSSSLNHFSRSINSLENPKIKYEIHLIVIDSVKNVEDSLLKSKHIIEKILSS